MSTLYLPLKKEWFEKIESGEKTVEYREKFTIISVLHSDMAAGQ